LSVHHCQTRSHKFIFHLPQLPLLLQKRGSPPEEVIPALSLSVAGRDPYLHDLPNPNAHEVTSRRLRDPAILFQGTDLLGLHVVMTVMAMGIVQLVLVLVLAQTVEASLLHDF